MTIIFFSIINNLLPTPKNFYRFAQKKVANYGANHILFTAFCYIHYIVPYFLWKDSLGVSQELMLLFRTIAVLLCAAVFFQKYWPEELYKKFYASFWYLTLLYALPFTTTVMLLATNGSNEWVVSIITVILCLVFLVDFQSFLILGGVGSLLGIIVYFTFIGNPSDINFDEHSLFLIFYQLMFGTILGTLISWKRSRDNQHKIGRTHTLADTLTTEVKNSASDMQSYAQQISHTFAEQNLTKITDQNGKQGYFIKPSFYDNLCNSLPLPPVAIIISFA